MRIDILTLFPMMFEGFKTESIIKRAIEKGKVEINIIDIRDYTPYKNNQVDDYQFGGGGGMIMMCEPVYNAVESIRTEDSHVILLTPRGKTYNQKKAYEFKEKKHLIIICGHYEGFDERIRSICDMEISIGDYVLTGGELPSMVITDSVVRLVPGVIDESSHLNDSFNNDKLDYPTYTKPRNYDGMEVPSVLVNGNHKEIDAWRKEESNKRTLERRPDLILKRFSLHKGKLDGSVKLEDLEGYSLNPKNNAKRLDVITVKNLKIIDNKFIENVTKKNVEKKLHQLLTLMVKVLESDDEDGEVLVLDEADRLNSLLLNDYIKILGEDYRNKIIKRIAYIVREFKTKKVKNREEVIEKSGKSR